MLASAISFRGGDVRACVGGDETIEQDTTFDPSVLGDATWKGLYFDPYFSGFAGACDACLHDAIAADWSGYLGATITDADWAHVLYELPDSDLAAISQRLAGQQIHIPKGMEKSSIWKSGAPVDKLRGAIELVRIARRVENVDTFDAGWDQVAQRPAVAPAPTPDMLADAKAGLAAARDPFLKQRYAFQVMRVMFYRQDWNGVATLWDGSSATLLAPSASLGWRARSYYAGALMRSGKRARGNLELARIAADDPPMAGYAMRDFQPMEDADWRKAQALAQTTRDKTALWRAVGIKADPLLAVREIVKLDPKSDLIGLLIVRDLARIENLGNAWGGSTDADVLAKQKTGYTALEQLCTNLLASPATAQPWILDLVIGHIAARRGDIVVARARGAKAMAARPNDTRVASQARASLAIALALDWRINPEHETELAKLMGSIATDKDFTRADAVRGQVRGKLAKAYAAAGKIIDAELLVPGTILPMDEYAGRPLSGTFDKSKWADAKFIQEMIARLGVTTTDFDRFVLQTSITKAQLQRDLALRYVLDGDFAAASKALTKEAGAMPLHVDPFVIHILDCHDCDQTKYANAPWTVASFIARLGELQKTANGTGEGAAEASITLGNALYNMTWFGNARVVAYDSHEQTYDTRIAEKWYKRAFDLTKDRERKAKAAFLAAKCERGQQATDILTAEHPEEDRVQDALGHQGSAFEPRHWFGVLHQFPTTTYYKEVLKECGYFADWVTAGAK